MAEYYYETTGSVLEDDDTGTAAGGAQYIDTGVRPDSITITDTERDRVIMRYEYVPYRHFKAEMVENINEETCKAVREHLYAKGYTDVLLLDDDFIREAIGRALREMAAKDGAQ